MKRNHHSQVAGSPSFSMKTNASVPSHTLEFSGSRHNQQRFPYLPPAAIANPSVLPSVQATRILTYSNVDPQSPDLRHPHQGSINKHARILPVSQMLVTPSGAWTDQPRQSHIDGTAPRLFPGIVHERTQRNSTRQGSGSEHDYSEPGLGSSKMESSKGEENINLEGSSGPNRPINHSIDGAAGD